MDTKRDTGDGEERRHQKMKTGFMFLLCIVDGLTGSSYGPTVKDYQCIFKENPQRISLLYPTWTTFKAVGVVMFIFLRNRFDIYLMSTTCTIIPTLLVTVIPLLPSFWLALFLSAAIGLIGGIACHARINEAGHLAKSSAVPLHLLPLGLSVGSFTGPLILSPFLGENQTQGFQDNMTTSLYMSSFSDGKDDAHECFHFESNVLYGFLIFLGISFITLVGYLTFRNVFRSDTVKDDTQSADVTTTTSKTDVLFFFLLALIIIIGGPTNSIYGNLLTTFGIHTSLDISSRTMALMTSSFFATTLIGRLAGTCFSLVVSQFILVTLCMIGAAVTAFGLLYLSNLNVLSLWVASSLLGFLFAPLFGGIVAWSSEAAQAKHNLYCLIVVSDLGGLAFMSFCMSQFIIHFGNNFFNYCILAVCIIQIIIFVVLKIIAEFVKRQRVTDLETSLLLKGKSPILK